MSSARRTTCWILGSLLLALLAAAAPAHAQGFTATVVGTVSDAGGEPLADAPLTVTNDETGQARTERSRADGAFTFTHLPPGRYRLTVEAAGFRTFEASNLALNADQVRRIDVRLEIGPVQARVEVVADLRTLNTDTPAKAEVVPNALIQALPLNGRNYLDLALLVPGVYRRVGDDQNDGVATNGTRWDATGFALDGVLNRSDRNGNSGVALAADAVREFDAQTSTYAAEYGRSAGAQINVVSKSGTNRFAGSLYDYVRDDHFDARNAFAPPGEPSTLSRQQAGGTLGGPIRRDRSFFFAAFERTHQRQSKAANSTAPNAAWLTGDFRNVRGAGPDGVWGTTDDTNRILDPATKREFPTPNVIPASRIDPVAAAILPFVPAANLAGTLDGYGAQGLAADDRQQLLVRLNHQWMSATALSLRWARSWGTSTEPFPSDRVFYPGFAQDADQQADSVVLSVTTRMGTRWVNDARAGYFQQDVETAGEQADTNYVGLFGLPGLSQDPSVWGFPTIRIDGFADFGDRPNSPAVYTLRNVQVVDTVTWTPDRHTVKAGLDIVQSQYDELDLRGIRGDFRFRGRATNPASGTSSGFRSFADFLLGQIDQSQRQVGMEPARLRGWQAAVFVQDDWRIRPSLTLSLGLRYERQAPLTEAADRLANFVPELGTVVLAGDSRYPPSLVRSDNDNIAPRAGFAWRPRDSERTVVRGGAGFYSSLEAYNVTRQQLAASYPFVLRDQYTRTNSVPVTFANPFPASLAAAQGVNAPLGMAVDYRTPEIYQYNLTVERELGPDLAFEIGYVGSQGRYLGRRYNLNQAIPAGLLPDGSLATARPYPQYADIQFQDQTISSSYNGLQTTLRRRMAGGLTMLLCYTLGKSIDSGSNSSGNLSNVSTTGAQKAPQDIYNMRAERGLSDFDRRHQFSAAFAYDLPFGAGRRWASDAGSLASALAGGWQVSGIVTLWSGRPFTPQYSAGDFATQRPDLASDPMVDIPAGLWFNPNAFARPVATAAQPDLYGNAGRNILVGPGYQNVDLAIARTFRAADGLRFQLRAEAFNLLNRANYQVPVFLLDASNVGQVTATQGDARQLQFALKVLF